MDDPEIKDLISHLCAQILTTKDEKVISEAADECFGKVTAASGSESTSVPDVHSLYHQIISKLERRGLAGEAEEFGGLVKELESIPGVSPRECSALLDFLKKANEDTPESSPSSNVVFPTEDSMKKVTVRSKSSVLSPASGTTMSSGTFRESPFFGSPGSDFFSSPPVREPSTLQKTRSGSTSGASGKSGARPTPPRTPLQTPLGKKGPEPEEMDRESLVKDAIYMIQGIDGHKLSWNSKRDEIVVDPSVKVGHGDMQMLTQICEYYGWVFIQIKSFADTHSIATPQPGMMATSFSLVFAQFVTDYYGLIAHLASQVEDGLTLFDVLCELEAWEDRLDLMCEFVHRIRDDHRRRVGGLLVSQVLSFAESGNPTMKKMARDILAKICLPLKVRIIAWMCDGILDDPHDEFFVSDNASVSENDLWTKRYKLRKLMLPYVKELDIGIRPETAKKIVTTGKAIIFLRSICKERGEEMLDLEKNRKLLNAMDITLIYQSTQYHIFEKDIDTCHLNVSAHLLAALREHHNLNQHFRALHSYLLLTDGAFSSTFMDLLHELEENRGRKLVFPETKQQRLGDILESAVDQSNPVHEIQDVKDRLRVGILDLEEDKGDSWANLTLKYKLDGPLSKVLTSGGMMKYLRLFNSLWRVKRLDFLLGRVSASLTHEGRNIVREIPKLSGVIHKFQLAAVEMRSLEICMLSYFYEEIKVIWLEFSSKLEGARDLDSLIRGNEIYLDACLRECLLDQKSAELQNRLRTMWEIIHGFIDLYRQFSRGCEKEFQARKVWDDMCERNTARGDFAYNSDREYKKERRESIQGLLEVMGPLELSQDLYRKSMVTLLMALCNQRKEKLRNLTLILDGNGYYDKIEPKLDQTRATLSRMAFVPRKGRPTTTRKY